MTSQLLENRYRILQELGQGGFGKTFLAEDIHMPSNRRCVIKQLKPVTNDPAVYQVVKERFQREAVILERLGEGNRQIPSLFAYFTAAGQFYLVQEWIEGETLTQRFDKNQGPLSSAEVSQLLIGLLPVLDFIHDQGIVHRDIKPDNIILRNGDQSPVLIDFGAVKETMGTLMNAAGKTTSSIVIGTPGFMPSEQAIGRPVFGSDLYSLGLTAVFLLTGKLPSDFPSDPATGKILWRSPDLNVDNHLANVLNQSICPHPRDRFTSAGAMLHALQAANQVTEQSSTPPTPFIAPVPETVVPPSAPVYSQPTVASQPNPVPVPAPVPTPTMPQAQQTYQQQTMAPPAPPPQKQGMADWQKAMLTGGMIGVCFLGGIIGYDQLMGDRNSDTDDPEVTLVDSDTSENSNIPDSEESDSTVGSTLPEDRPPIIEEIPDPDPVDPPPPVPELPPEVEVLPINEFDAEAVVVEWLRCKSELFSFPYDTYCGEEVLTGRAYNNNIQRRDGEASSVEWLADNGAYYIFENQQIESIESFQFSGRDANVQLVVTEQRTLYDSQDRVDKNASGYDQRLVDYKLEFTAEGTWKIADYRTIDVLWE